MNIRFRVIWLFWAVISASAFAEDTVHIIRRGETVYSIARIYGISPDEVIRVNGLTDPSKIQVGQRIRIPQGRVSGGFAEYRVNRGDTLSSISRRYGVTLQALRSANGFSETYVLKEGERIKIPSAPPPLPAAGGGSAPARVPQGPINFGDVVSPAAPARPVERTEASIAIRWPVAAKEVTYMTGKLYGVVLLGERAEPVKSLTQGTVVSAGSYRGFGKVVIVQMPGGYFYVSGGCESLSVKEGDRVEPETELGRLGIDGVSAKPQLFFMVYLSNTPIDPAKAPRA
jgi:murein DD-endopeptidase MepM/ murein hydrolase activator NlpD